MNTLDQEMKYNDYNQHSFVIILYISQILLVLSIVGLHTIFVYYHERPLLEQYISQEIIDRIIANGVLIYRPDTSRTINLRNEEPISEEDAILV